MRRPVTRGPTDETVEIHGTLHVRTTALGGLRHPDEYFSWYKNHAESTQVTWSFAEASVAFFALLHHDREAW